MNYMKQVADMLGVELGEEFTIKGAPASRHYKLLEKGDILYSHDGKTWCSAASILYPLILTGKWEIIKLPFKPKQGDMCFFVTPSGNVSSSCYDTERFSMLLAYCIKSGNCYRTKEEAEKHVDEWVEFFKEAAHDN